MNAEAIIAKSRDLPTPSPSLTRLLELVNRNDIDNEAIVQVVQQDPALTGKLLALCNSAVIGLGSPVGSLDEAIFYLGRREIHRLVLAIGFGGALRPPLKGYGMGDGGLWTHSLVTAHASNIVLQACSGIEADPSIAYTAGLLHDLGKLLFNHVLDAPTQASIRELIEKSEHSMLEAEHAILGTDHAEVGACLLTKWRIPENIVEAVANHHKPAIEPAPQLSAVIHIADVLAHEAGATPGWASFAVRPDEAAVNALGLDAIVLQRLLVDTYETLEEVKGLSAAA